MKILSAVIENFKNIEAKTVELNGKSIMVVGSNGKGKSSFIQALMSPLDSKYTPSKPIKDGEERGTIQLVVGGEIGGRNRTYTIDTYFTPSNEKGRVVVTNDEGEETKNAKGFVKDIVGNIGFDMFEFISLGRTKEGKVSTPGVRQQIEILKGLMPKEIRHKLEDIDAEYETQYADRQYDNRKISELEAYMGNSEYSQEDIKKYSTKIDVKLLNEELTSISVSRLNTQKYINNVDHYAKAVDRLTDDLRIAQENLDINQKLLSDAPKTQDPEKVQSMTNLQNVHGVILYHSTSTS